MAPGWTPAQCGGELSDRENITNVTPSLWGSSLTEEKSHKGDRAVCSLSRASVTSNSDKDCSVKTIVSFCKKSGCLWNCSFKIAYGTFCTANSLIQYSVQINRHDTLCVFEMLFVIILSSRFQYGLWLQFTVGGTRMGLKRRLTSSGEGEVAFSGSGQFRE